MNNVTLKYHQVNFIQNRLPEVRLNEHDLLSSRRIFLRNLRPVLDLIEDKQKEIQHAHAEKNDDGTLKKDGMGKIQFSPTGHRAAETVWLAFLEEEIDLVVTEHNQLSFERVAKILQDDYEMHCAKFAEAKDENGKEVGLGADQFEFLEVYREIIEKFK